MQRFSNHRRVFFWEEHIPTDHHLPYLEFHAFDGTEVVAVRPRIPHAWQSERLQAALSRLLDQLLALTGAERPILWFYTPVMYPIAQHIDAAAVVYDCMDELSAFRFAPPDLRAREKLLMQHADVVFTGGHSIYEAKRYQHGNIHAFPSSVDFAHFVAARSSAAASANSAKSRAVLGYYGVIDERIDLDLIAKLAVARPDWSMVMVGPIAKIDPLSLPQAKNIHYPGRKDYAELPACLAGWDVALMPFAINEATRFISPTKTPEYLAAGRPVVSTPVPDVVRHYGDVEGVLIAGDTDAFIAACEQALALSRNRNAWLPAVDRLLARTSWDQTFLNMSALVDEAIAKKSEMVSTPAKPVIFRPTGAAPYDYLVVGAGFAGSVLAERLATSGKRVFLCDRRPHIAGNTFDMRNEAGILIHKYGPHIFHTNSEEIFAYLSRFTRWRPYEHRVLADVGRRLIPIPINRTTLNGLYGLDLKDEAAAADFLASRAEPVADIRTSRDVVISQVGTDLYRTFFEGYTRKQWGLDPSQLDKSVTARIPTRTSTDDRYFLDTYQAMPADGFTRLFENMLYHDNIRVETGVDHRDLDGEKLARRTIFTGPIDAFFLHRLGPLPYRSLEFRHETLDQEQFQPVAVVNYPSEDVPYTRVTEYKHLTGQSHAKTSISYEYARADGDPYYPIPRPENQSLYKQYEALARTQDDVIFVGRLGTYKYYNMDQVVGQALATFRRLEKAEAMAAENWTAAAE
ncbi:UDP-galactopyranose mutase [Mesorhizobium sp. IMUNJ 23232]|uniref:UDP-galactopyranose mutase n=1 Tax=Mesorhizobium sp. IMUNJ 23232 TaxID=3376064 RepID=UPI003792B9E5